MFKSIFIAIILFGVCCIGASKTRAEPYLAVREGMFCSSCHVNISGGGMRNAFGNVYGQNQLVVRSLLPSKPWTGELVSPIYLGGNARQSVRNFDVDDVDTNSEFTTDRVSIYLSAALNDFVSLMVDQQVAPGGSINRESWLQIKSGAWYVKAGKMFLPFGWRLEDDSAFVRQVTGINFNSGDNGMEFGYEQGAWSAQLAVTNGSGGSNSELDDGKQSSFRVAHLNRNFQIGVNANLNNTDLGERTTAGVFVGLNTGPVTWLGEWNQIDNSDFVGGVDQQVGLLEANYLLTKGHNLKVTLESHQFDSITEDRRRLSVVYEYFPMSFTQFRIGLRERDSDDPNALLNSREMFGQMHVYF